MDYKAPIPTQDYKVVIKCFTYNQENYIEDALKGFVRQKTNFPFCAVVVDDCSTDGTADIIKHYERQYPEIIKGIYLPENMFKKPLEKSKYILPWQNKAQYLAYCEGDDYWIDDNKLQWQVDFLDNHSDYFLCFHNALVRYQDLEIPDVVMRNFETGDFDVTSLFKNWQLPYASILMRREVLLSNEYSELSKSIHGGILLFMAAARMGKVYGKSVCLSVYRKSITGLSNTMSLSYCHKVLYDFAKATQDRGAIKYRINTTEKALAGIMHRVFVGNKDAIELLKTSFQINKVMVVRAFFRMLVHLPANIVSRLI